MVFGPFPTLAKLAADAGPLGTPEEREASARLSEARREAINRVFANLGKAIGAYERTLSYGRSRFDRYIEVVQAGDRAGQQTLTRDEVVAHATARPWPIASRSACRTKRRARWSPSCATWQAR